MYHLYLELNKYKIEIVLIYINNRYLYKWLHQ